MQESAIIRTPENVAFEHELAGLSSRALAWAVDMVAMGIVLAAGGQLLQGLTPSLGGFGPALTSLLVFLVLWWYSALAEWGFQGRTLGKWVVGLRTIRQDGLPLTLGQAVIRNLLRVVDLLPGLFLVGGLSALLDPYGRRLGDLAAGTLVVRDRRAPTPNEVLPRSERHNSFLRDPAIAHAARRISAPERDAMVGLGLRRDALPIAVRRELFGRLAAHLEERLGVERPRSFSEEKLVLNLTALVLGEPASPEDGRDRR